MSNAHGVGSRMAPFPGKHMIPPCVIPMVAFRRRWSEPSEVRGRCISTLSASDTGQKGHQCFTLR